jgi:hypothetical protein
VGDRVRLRGSGRYRDLVGRIESRGRTRYTVRTDLGLVTAPFALVEVVDAEAFGDRRLTR